MSNEHLKYVLENMIKHGESAISENKEPPEIIEAVNNTLSFAKPFLERLKAIPD
jgi:hypothetical protein